MDGDLIRYGVSLFIFTLMVANALGYLEKRNWWRLPSAWAVLAGLVFACGGSKTMVFMTLGVPFVVGGGKGLARAVKRFR